MKHHVMKYFGFTNVNRTVCIFFDSYPWKVGALQVSQFIIFAFKSSLVGFAMQFSKVRNIDITMMYAKSIFTLFVYVLE